ncbi:hypothetical protein FRX31_021753 [Thalictrum thalictroides]|uniref:Uncharacterized protein n=1 Tax=Thalictrum thalictroides TaxID=46969 RepID=A0A7J6VWW5_THATH|nr:hypothetical protein FRX31_021753 [Thalictrum thalictroides]
MGDFFWLFVTVKRLQICGVAMVNRGRDEIIKTSTGHVVSEVLQATPVEKPNYLRRQKEYVDISEKGVRFSKLSQIS